jgi:hypothetical protein
MKKQFETLTEINTKEIFDVVDLYSEAVLREATEVGALDPIDVENDYTRELGRLYNLLADYEDKYEESEFIIYKDAVHQPKKKTSPEQQPKPRKAAYA